MVKIKGSITVSDKKMWDKFKNVIMRPMTDEDRYTKLELIIKKKLAALKKKKKNTKKKGGKKSKRNIKMARKFRRTRRKRGRGGLSKEQADQEMMRLCGSLRSNIQKARNEGKSQFDIIEEFTDVVNMCNTNYFREGAKMQLEKLGGKKSRRKKRRKSKKRKSRKRKKRSRRRKRKKR